jgi:glutamate synthase (NADPH/NADH) small chain
LSTETPGLSEHWPPLTNNEALVEAHRCLFCYDAPCTQACPTHIDIPRFIKKISTGNLKGSATTIFNSNLLGATCARVCPVQELCEGACVLGAEHRPIMIGRLQRFAMDYAYGNGNNLVKAGAPTGKRIAVIGAGPAGLSCAGELARKGHAVTIFERHALGGGLSTYGIIVLREPVEIALAEVEMIRHLGVEIKTGVEVGVDIGVEELRRDFDAVFVSVGLGATPELRISGEEHILDGLEFIQRSKLDTPSLRVGRNVVVIGAGNTAIDCATIAKRLGADRVTMIYRRTEREMTAYDHEYDFVKREGVVFEFRAQPVRVIAENGAPCGIECARVIRFPELLPDSEFVIPADQIVKAIGQQRPSIAALFGLRTVKGLIEVGPGYETNIPKIYAGGDCVRVKGAASTVMAVQDGKLAAQSIAGALHG